MKSPKKKSFIIEGDWKIEHMNIELLKKYNLYNIIPGYSDLISTAEDWKFVEELVNGFKIELKGNTFYTLLWAVVYFKKERFEYLPMELLQQEGHRKNDLDNQKTQKLKKELRDVLKINLDTFLDDKQRRKLTEVRFTIKGQPFKTNSRRILDQFYSLILKPALILEAAPASKKTNSKKEITAVIERLYPFASMLHKEKILPSKNKVYEFMESVLSYYQFNTHDRLDLTAQIKNTLKLK
jgi:hypothetical protein